MCKAGTLVVEIVLFIFVLAFVFFVGRFFREKFINYIKSISNIYRSYRITMYRNDKISSFFAFAIYEDVVTYHSTR